MASRAEQREQTRRTLVRESRQLFATKGYAAVGLSEIVRAAGVTKGALYHHFESKAELFGAVLAEVQQEVADTVAATADAQDDPWDRFTTGCQAFLTASTDPATQRIMLIDGPAVLGWNEWRAMDEAGSARHLADALADLIEAGLIARQPVAPLAHLLSGAMNEAALWLATSPGDLDATRAALAQMLDALRAASEGAHPLTQRS
ncbi:TetR/AcrR family transcriptional regulator [Actinomadura rudentiformis]|uniref:TetR/AcrR family transcriptional regulator n=1 Tax=Actinomadura rudentiformis TaxID=359158 RepID=A0A6H9YM73_9ACTN|nr:TetR/AcrR family transcriptional regulator [Actinomadura rudentiformis]KAB2344369.1 TetR/AcrR family transcriptional regulator [Actinomadura rudentiformis]